jgi:hypothetical protein
MTHLGYYFLATDISLAANNMSCGHTLATLPRWEPETVLKQCLQVTKSLEASLALKKLEVGGCAKL